MTPRSPSFALDRRDVSPPALAPAFARVAAARSPLTPPAWAVALGGDSDESSPLRLISVRRAGARDLDDAAFAAAARAAYDALRLQANHCGRPFPVRIWNFIPAIHARSRDGDRYMTFNAGRYQAMSKWFEGDGGEGVDGLARRAPSATGVGHDGADLVLHALVSDRPPVHIENDQQVPAYRYSPRYGRLPPCFARATRAGDLLMISGTAAVLGEESRHPRAFDEQLALAVEHLQSVTRRGIAGLAAFEHVRVYLPPGVTPDYDAVIAKLPPVGCGSPHLLSALTNEGAVNRTLQNIEFVTADLCRKELLVEIEALACAQGANA